MRSFQFYEFVAILLPGALVLFGVSLLFPQIGSLLLSANVSFGDLGIFVILAYACGHILQALGNFIEYVWWDLIRRGKPTDWILLNQNGLLSEQQAGLLSDLLKESFGDSNYAEMNSSARNAIVRQVYSMVQQNGVTGRIEVFNGNYGLNRGLVAAFIGLSVMTVIGNIHLWNYACILFAIAMIALYRMNRFGKHYARELFVEFINLRQKK